MTQPSIKAELGAVPGSGMTVRPSLMGALRGMWAFTWKANMTWGRAVTVALGLLVLPALVFLTTPSMDKWSRRNSVLGSSGRQVADLAQQLQQAGAPLSADQRKRIGRIFAEEFARAEKQLREAAPGQNTVNRQRDLIRDAYDHIYDRTRGLLTEGQFAPYRAFEAGALQQSRERVREARWSRTEPFYHWLIDFYFFVMLPLNCIRSCGGLIRDEVQANTLGFLTTRPASRARLVLAKFIAQAGWLQLLLLSETLLLFLAGVLKQLPDLGKLLPLFLLAQVLAVLAWSALGALLGLSTKRYMAAGLLYGLVVEIGIGQIPTNINNLSLVRQFKSVLSRDEALQSVFNWTEKGLPTSFGVILSAIIVFLVASALLFTCREYHHTVEMQK